MAHAAPRSRGLRGARAGGNRRVTARPPRSSDLFSERTHARARYAIPVVLGLVYGYWAAANQRHGGPVTGWNMLFGFVTALVFAALCIAVATVAPRFQRELHSGIKSAFAGAAVGFLYSQASNVSVLRAAVMGLVVAVGIYGVFFYRSYTREDAQGNRIR
jgi:hypothetical protein